MLDTWIRRLPLRGLLNSECYSYFLSRPKFGPISCAFNGSSNSCLESCQSNRRASICHEECGSDGVFLESILRMFISVDYFILESSCASHRCLPFDFLHDLLSRMSRLCCTIDLEWDFDSFDSFARATHVLVGGCC